MVERLCVVGVFGAFESCRTEALESLALRTSDFRVEGSRVDSWGRKAFCFRASLERRLSAKRSLPHKPSSNEFGARSLSLGSSLN